MLNVFKSVSHITVALVGLIGSLESAEQKDPRTRKVNESMKIRTKLGWPVETIKGRHLTNLMRLIIHGNISQTYKHLHKEKYVGKLTEAYNQGVINSSQLHALATKFDRI